MKQGRDTAGKGTSMSMAGPPPSTTIPGQPIVLTLFGFKRCCAIFNLESAMALSRKLSNESVVFVKLVETRFETRSQTP
jgi:hypothetical protein